MMRAIAALFMGVLTALYATLFAIPMLYTAKTNSLSLFNQTDPVIAQSIAIGNGFYNIIPLVPIFVGIFAIAAISIRREPGE